ncbi:hypothetical protein C2G38_2208936 [Gigaspora rosea]|uniref:Uncharacterized protein n=1 Tax=Gigaspora rosea TaxID=44941 RepID=A0A397UGP2_9GLOM|nr:hypothetical protein C2G38_2208936 [Gigaspora rosea]
MVNDQNHSYIDKHDSSSSTQIFGLDEQNAKLERELEDLDKCVDRDTVVDLIHEIVPLLLIIKRKVEIIEVGKRKAVPYKQRRKARPKKAKKVKPRRNPI